MLDRSQLTSEEVALRILVALIRHHGCDTNVETQQVLVATSCDLTELFREELQDRGKEER